MHTLLPPKSSKSRRISHRLTPPTVARIENCRGDPAGRPEQDQKTLEYSRTIPLYDKVSAPPLILGEGAGG